MKMHMTDSHRALFTRLLAVLMVVFMSKAYAIPETNHDMDIQDNIEDELLYDGLVLPYGIDVTVEEGVATLSGHVADILSKDRAAKIAMTVRGVTSVINRITVIPPEEPTEMQLKKNIEKRFHLNPATDAYEIDISVDDGKVVLTGAVDSYQEKRLVGSVVKGVKGVIELDNRLGIAYKKSLSEKEIAAEVQERLKYDVLVDHALVRVSVKGDKVTLSGIVGSMAEKTRAVSDAFVSGVKGVDAWDLKVMKWARDEDLRKQKYEARSDKAVAEAISLAFIYDPRVSPFSIAAEVSSGVVTLRGEVDNVAAKRAAGQDAMNTAGVEGVKNRIKVKPVEQLSDQEIADNIRWGYSVDPYVDRYDILVNAYGGVVDLSGIVESYFEKARADDIAAQTSGVVAVINNVMVRNQNSRPAFSPYETDVYPLYNWWNQPVPLRSYSPLNDKTIAHSIRTELFLNPHVNSQDIDVDVNEGIAFLKGTVASWPAKREAVKEAYEGGAVWVYDRLTINRQN